MIAPARSHAVLSASGSHKWLTCTPSARFESSFPDETSEFSAEGQYAHELAELKLRYFLGEHIEREYQEKLAQLRTKKYWNAELEEYVGHYVDYCVSRIHHARDISPDAVILVEARLDFSTWVPEGFGTGDLVLVYGNTVEVIDLKFGRGYRVDALANPQLRLYGLGAFYFLGQLFEIEQIRMTIFQPRLDHISTDELSTSALLQWANEFVAPRAQLAWRGEGSFVAGDHCSSGFCKARYQCAARAEESYAIAQRSFALKPPELLSADQLSEALSKAPAAIQWLHDVQAFALRQAEAGITIPNFKLVAGRSTRRLVNHDAVASKLTEAGVDDALIYERSLISMGALEKLLGKHRFTELLGEYVIKPPGKPLLVPDTDQRQALEPITAVFLEIPESRS
jgi:hypothetical protein